MSLGCRIDPNAILIVTNASISVTSHHLRIPCGVLVGRAQHAPNRTGCSQAVRILAGCFLANPSNDSEKDSRELHVPWTAAHSLASAAVVIV